MRRVSFCIGCDAYSFMDRLSGGENDANRIHDVLVNPNFGNYDADLSILLKSPTKAEAEIAINGILRPEIPLDTFCIYFAGHGGVKGGSYYLCMADSKTEHLSASAISLTSILLRIAELAPVQTYVIIDSCESGGMSNDLGTIIKSSVLGDAGTPAITLLATAAQDQTAEEEGGHGIGTSAIHDCITGKELIQDTNESLDLIEIARHISKSLAPITTQTPITYGLNIFGVSRFCKNPRFSGDKSFSFDQLHRLWPEMNVADLNNYRESLWRLYNKSNDENWSAADCVGTLSRVLNQLSSLPDVLVSFVDRFSSALLQQGRRSRDCFRVVAIIGATLTCLIKYNDQDAVKSCIRRWQSRLASETLQSARYLIETLEQDAYALLDPYGGMADFFFLPIRISQILAWVSVAAMTPSAEADNALLSLLRKLTTLVIEKYEGSLSAISDEQAAYWNVAIDTLIRTDMHDLAEQIVCLLFLSLSKINGRIAARDIQDEMIMQFLLCRSKGVEGPAEMYARPSELIAALLVFAKRLDLDEVIDPQLWRLDGRTIFMFSPSNFNDFGDILIETGTNTLLQIGHDIFRVADLSQYLQEPTTLGSVERETMICALCCSLTLSDRVPWLLMHH